MALDLIEQWLAYINGIRLRTLLDSRREIDAVANQVIAGDHHVGQVQAKSQLQSTC